MNRTFRNRIIVLGAAMAAFGTASAQTSPDGHLSVSVDCQNGLPTYSVKLDDDVVIGKSALGLQTSIGDFSKELTLSATSQPRTVADSYSLPNAKKSDIFYNANEVVYTFSHGDQKSFDLIVRVDNSNVAFRYMMYAQKDRLACLVNKEATSYTLPEGTTTFLCPQMTPQTGFARTAPSYETFYEYDAEMGKNGHGRGYTFPALFKTPKAWVMLSETNVGGNYCGSRIESTGACSYGIAYPEDTEFGGVGTSAPGLMLATREEINNKAPQPVTQIERGYTPWRTITVGRTMKEIAETTIQWDLVSPQYEAKYDYKYGRSAWSWIIRMDASCNYDEQKEYVDFAAQMGWEYLLVDAWWDTNIGYEAMERLSRYAQSKGVALFLWYNSNGYWNDAMQGPRGKMHRAITRRQEMAWMQQAGIKGIKVDFVGSDKQQTMQMYEDILADANDYGIMVIFHGCTLQRGWERMYPNFIACEAVRASENMAFGQYDNDQEARCATIHPVLRNSVGNMDFGGSTLNKHYSKNNERGTTRRTSDVFALATAILLQTPVQNFAMAPNNLTDAPAWAVDFMKQVPTTWEDVRYIDGYPGKYLVMARKHEGKWYFAAINAEQAPVTVTVPADLFSIGETVSVYTDDKNLVGSVKAVKVGKKAIKLTVPCNGAAVVY